MIITIDGPAGAGKSTAARKLANKLGFVHLNSGALFRVVAFKAQENGIRLDDDDAVAALAAATDFEFRLQEEAGNAAGINSRKTVLFVDGSDLNDVIRTDAIGQIASRIAVLPKLREVLLQVQRKIAQGHSVVLEGRDSGTVVFPKAELKFYLDAAPAERAKRRFLELNGTQQPAAITLEGVMEEMQERDNRELSRDIAPLRPADDAIFLDSTNLSLEEVVEKMSVIAEKIRQE